ncbi:hypothetical protein ABIF20_008204 [Bradyrhizobium japonicum]
MGSRIQMVAAIAIGIMAGMAPARAEVAQCRFIQAKAEREACYQRQEAALAAKRRPEPSAESKTLETMRQMRQDDDAVYRSINNICRGC